MGTAVAALATRGTRRPDNPARQALVEELTPPTTRLAAVVALTVFRQPVLPSLCRLARAECATRRFGSGDEPERKP